MFESPRKLLSEPLKPVKLTVTLTVVIPISPNQTTTAEFKLAEMYLAVYKLWLKEKNVIR